MKSTLESTHGVVRFSLKESIKSLEKTPRKDNLIVMHFSSKGKRFKKSIGYKCSLNNWDVKKQKVKTGKGMMQNAYKINERIDEIRTFIENELTNMESDNGAIVLDKLSYLVSCKINGNENNDKVNEKLLIRA